MRRLVSETPNSANRIVPKPGIQITCPCRSPGMVPTTPRQVYMGDSYGNLNVYGGYGWFWFEDITTGQSTYLGSGKDSFQKPIGLESGGQFCPGAPQLAKGE
jgi:hypothetical protein